MSGIVARIPTILISLRKVLRRVLFQFLKKVSDTDDARAMAHQMLRGLLAWRPHGSLETLDPSLSPYLDLGTSQRGVRQTQRSDVIFITAQFRSGSTLLWNVFRNIEGVTAYYEPFNERRWFDPLSRGSQTDPTHQHVSEYWREYAGLDALNEYYREEWIQKNLFMDAHFWSFEMKRYIELLIENASGRPVLQFNRINFRLPWIRATFPDAKVVHLYRHPRDQWCSMLIDPTSFPKSATMEHFPPHDKFYLRMWAQDLKYHFPFLDERTISHPYTMLYYLWKLSYLFGIHYAHYSIAFERLVTDPDSQLQSLLQALSIEQYDMEILKSLIVRPSMGRWKAYAEDDWFRHQETVCETVLAEFFSSRDLDMTNVD